MKTFSAKSHEVNRDWYVVDATGKTLGRLASEIARFLFYNKLLSYFNLNLLFYTLFLLSRLYYLLLYSLFLLYSLLLL